MSKHIVGWTRTTICAIASAGLFAAAGCGAVVPEGEATPGADPHAEAVDSEGAVGLVTQSIQLRGLCTRPQKRELPIFHDWLRGYVSDSFYMLSTGNANQRLLGYFNPVTDAQRSTVFRRLDHMEYSLENDEYTYNCAPWETSECSFWGYTAWVAPGGNNREINLCPEFWEQDNQMRLFALVHEVSHLFGTDDFVHDDYAGRDFELALDLPHLSPEHAVQNANNYAFFVMNPYGL